MATTQINGSSQILVASIPNSKLVKAPISADGTQAATADISLGSHKLTNVTDPTSAQDAATKNYVDTVAQGLDAKQSVRAATTTALMDLPVSGQRSRRTPMERWQPWMGSRSYSMIASS